MTTVDLISELNQTIAIWGNCEIWMECDTLTQPIVIETWGKPHFEKPVVVIRAEGNEF